MLANILPTRTINRNLVIRILTKFGNHEFGLWESTQVLYILRVLALAKQHSLVKVADLEVCEAIMYLVR